MKDFFYNIYDLFLNLFEKIIIIIVVAILALIILSRINKLFKINVLNIEDKLPINQEEIVVKENGNAPIYYMGELPEEKAVEEIEDVKVDNDTNAKNQLNIIAFEIKEEDTIKDVMETLRSVGLIQDPVTMENLITSMNLNENITPGTYRVPENIKNLDLIETITIAAKE